MLFQDSTMEKKIEDLTVLMNNIGTNLDRKIDGIQESTNALRTHIEEVKTNILRDIQNLETQHVNDNQDRKVQIENLSNRVDDNHVTTDAKIVALEEKIKAHETRMDRQDVNFRSSQITLQIAQNTIVTQTNKIQHLERSSHAGLQHNREWNVEIDGIPINVGDNPAQLQEATLKILRAINIVCHDSDIDTIHRLPSRNDIKPTIVRFHSRKLVRLIHGNKTILKDLADLHIDIPGLNENSRIFIRASQCPYYRSLSYKCRQLKRANQIEYVSVGNDGRITIKTLDNEFVKITHESDLIERFPLFEFRSE